MCSKVYLDINISTEKKRQHKTVIKPALCYGSVTWTKTQIKEQMVDAFERKFLRTVYDPMQGKGCWPPRWNIKC